MSARLHLSTTIGVAVSTLALTACGATSPSSDSGATTSPAPWPSVMSSPSTAQAAVIDGPQYDDVESLAARGTHQIRVAFRKRLAQDNEAALNGRPAHSGAPEIALWRAEVVEVIGGDDLAAGEGVIISVMQGVDPTLEAIGPDRQALLFVYPNSTTWEDQTVFSIAGVAQGLAPVTTTDGDLGDQAPAPFDGLETVEDVAHELAE